MNGEVGGWKVRWRVEGRVGGMTNGTLFVLMSVFPMKGLLQRHRNPGPSVFRREALRAPWGSFRVFCPC